ncbi:MAG: hypothetical protein ACYDGR_17255 [Candidatus Dormibacteria bacterium]
MSAGTPAISMRLSPHLERSTAAGMVHVAAASVSLGMVAYLLRVPFAGHVLFNWDSLQFALGMRHFDLAAHRPHPPGYIGYIALGRLFMALGSPDVNGPLVMFSGLAEAATVAGVFLFARQRSGNFAGLAASLLLLTSPLYWLYGETALTYAIEPGLALAGLWAVWRSGSSWRRLAVAAVVIGASGALRPSSEFFLLPLLGWGVLRAWRISPNRRWSRPGLVALAAGATTACWLLPLLALSGGLTSYLRASAQLGARVSANSAIWRAGPGGLAMNSGAVGRGFLMSLGLAVPLLASAAILAVIGDRRAARVSHRVRAMLRRPIFQASVVMTLPALLTYELVHIGQVAYVLFAVPPLLLVAGPALEYVATRLGGGRRVAGALLAACVVFNVAFFATPFGNLRSLVSTRDRQVAAEIQLVRNQLPGRVALLTDPEGPSSYRTAMYYLAEVPAIAVGRDDHGRAGEFFADFGPGPGYSLDRFRQVVPLTVPSGVTGLLLDAAILRSIGDPGRLGEVDGPARAWTVPLLAADPPVAFGSWLYLRASDCPCEGAGNRPPARRGRLAA